MLLIRHPATPCAALDAVTVDLDWQGDQLLIEYTLSGRVSLLCIPPTRQSARRDGLWRNLCCELFLRQRGSSGYREFNFSPTTEWAAYSFTDYRQGMAPLEVAGAPQISVDADATRWCLRARLPLAGAEDLTVGCAVVVEESSGALSYWALRHPEGKPDFHHADGFIAVRN